MSTPAYNDSLDTRLAFKVYAIVAWTVGGLLYGWGCAWFPLPLAGLPYSDWAAARVAAAALACSGFLAIAMARTLDEDGRRRALGWWAVGHVVVLVGVSIQLTSVVGSDHLGWGSALGLGWLAAGFFLFSDFWWNADGIRWGGLENQHHDSLLQEPRQSNLRRLRSTYEEKIREAASQEERHRLARDLHDSIKQQIFVMHTAAATAQARFESDPAGARAAIDQVRNAAREAMAEMEALLDQLRAAPLENGGLIEALKKQCEALRFRTGADVRLVVQDLPPSETLPVGAQQVLLRVAQEALANIGRHARAKQVEVTLDSSPITVQLRVNDDGVGFDTALPPSGMGLGNMRSRVEALGGSLAVTSEPGKGTLIRASIPHASVETVGLRAYRRRALFWCSFAVANAALQGWIYTRERDLPFLALNAAFTLMLASQAARVAVSYLRARRVLNRLPRKARAQ